MKGRAGPRRLITDDFGAIRLYRRCPRCTTWQEQRIGNFSPRKRDPQTRKVLRWDSWCRRCRKAFVREFRARETPEKVLARSRRRWAKVKADEKALAMRRQTNAASARKARLNNPEAQRQSHQRWYRKLKADPERYAVYLENRRIAHHLRQERKGMPVTKHMAGAVRGFRSGTGSADRRLPIEPFAMWVDELLAREVPDRGRGHGDGEYSSRDARSKTIGDVCAELGVEDRMLTRMEQRTYRTVTLGVADRMLTNYGKTIVITGDSPLVSLEQKCRNMAGNGERILRYIDEAEALYGYLDGAVIDRVEDLWPELA